MTRVPNLLETKEFVIKFIGNHLHYRNFVFPISIFTHVPVLLILQIIKLNKPEHLSNGTAVVTKWTKS